MPHHSTPEKAQFSGDFESWLSFSEIPMTVAAVTPAKTQGHFEGVVGRKAVAPRFGALASDLVALRSSRQSAVFPPHYVIKMSLNEREIRVASAPPIALNAGSALVVASLEGLELEGSFEAGVRYREFFLMIAPDAELDNALGEQVACRMSRQHVETFPVDASLLERVRALLDPVSEGLVSGLLAESCALELLARSLAWVDAPDSGVVSMRDRHRILAVRDAMIAEPGKDHRLSTLARDVGLSVTGLRTKFHAVFGKSVVAYLRDVRLRRAWQGIAKDGWTVSQAAYFVGYRHQSSFSTAFRRKFGIWPSDLRQL